MLDIVKTHALDYVNSLRVEREKIAKEVNPATVAAKEELLRAANAKCKALDEALAKVLIEEEQKYNEIKANHIREVDAKKAEIRAQADVDAEKLDDPVKAEKLAELDAEINRINEMLK